MKPIPTLILAGTLFGCAHLPTPEEIAHADYGPFPDNYEQIVKIYYSSVLKDPNSAIYKEITSPRTWALGNRLEGAKFGYLVCVTLNAKNSYGGYVGYKTDALLIRNSAVIEYIQNGVYFGHAFW